MEFSYSQVEAALAALHRIADQHREAFRGRLKHFQRNGFPPGVNTGKGKRASYSLAATCQLAIALELVQFGLIPQRIIELVTNNWSSCDYPVAFIIDEIWHHGQPGSPELPDTNHWVLTLSPESLRWMTKHGENKFDSFEAMEAVRAADLPELIAKSADRTPVIGEGWRLATIDLTTLIRTLLGQLALDGVYHDFSELRQEVLQWIEEKRVQHEKIQRFAAEVRAASPDLGGEGHGDDPQA